MVSTVAMVAIIPVLTMIHFGVAVMSLKPLKLVQ
jgi:hypothetical protein